MGDIFRGNTSLSKIYRGQTELSKVYRGQTEIWANFTPLPAWSSNFNVIYSALYSDTFTDQSGNSNDGTVSGTIPHVSGISPYWDFSSSNYVATGVVPGALLKGSGVDDATAFTMLMLYQAKTTTADAKIFYAYDDTNDLLSTSISTTGTISNFQGTPSNKEIIITGLTTDTWYLQIVTKDVITANYYNSYINNTLAGDSGDGPIDMNIFNQIEIGQNPLGVGDNNDFRLAAFGWAKGYSPDATDRTNIYNFFKDYYSI